MVKLKEEMFETRSAAEAAAAARIGDAELQTALRTLERDTELLKRKLSGGLLSALGVDGAALAGAARQSDLLEVVAAVDRKVDKAEVQKLLRKAVTVALEAYRAAAEAAAAEAVGQAGRALKSKCLSCDRDVEPFRPLPLGPLPSAAGLLPNVERFVNSSRPGTAVSNLAPAAPHGPGLNAAELRRQQQQESNSARRRMGERHGQPASPETLRRASPTPPPRPATAGADLHRTPQFT